MSLTGNINFSGLLNGDVDCGQGSNVIPNPSGTATADLYKLQIDETIYNIEGSGGTEVIPNPSGTATDDLTKLQINDTIYQIEGEQGPAGYSPEVTIDTITGGHSVTITDEDHPSGQTFNVMDGTDGTDGTNGTSAYASVSKSGNTATIICTDANGTTTAQISDGTDGTNGTDGTDGTSAYATVSKSGNTATITCTDANGTTTATVSDGSDGTNGTDGTSAYASVSKVGSTATITCTDANGTTTATVSDGTNGQGVPTGGTSGQYLKKDSSTDYDTSFANIQASEVSYDNTSSGMTATTSQGAIDELKSNLTDLERYSLTEEIPVGYWVDGSIIYRKTFVGNISATDIDLGELPNFYRCIKGYGWCTSANNNSWGIPSGRTDGYNNRWYIQTATKHLHLQFADTTSIYPNTCIYYFTVEYIKSST